MAVATETSAPFDLSGDRRRLRRERRVRWVFFAAAAVSVVITVAIVLSLAGQAWSFLSEIASDPETGLGSLAADGWCPRRGRYQVMALIVHTLMVSAIAMVFAVPLGLGSAIYLSEYASPRVRRVLKPTLEILAGIPSVVLGFFALTFITPSVVKAIFDDAANSNFLAAGIAVGVLLIPLVASVSEDAMRAVPISLREASYGLGAKRWHTSLRVVVPAALSGIAAAIILAVSRAIGETMIVALAAGTNGIMNISPLEGGLTMTGAMAQLAIGSDQVTGSSSAFQSLYFVGIVLFFLTLGLNILSNSVVRRFRQRY
jgi:phosphate transport system permease protein